MALKILQPGLRPIGQFALDDDASNIATYLTGGEGGVLQASSSDTAASDSKTSGPFSAATANHLEVTFGGIAADGPVFLMDEGSAGYGTQFGELIGAVAGQATSQSGE